MTRTFLSLKWIAPSAILALFALLVPLSLVSQPVALTETLTQAPPQAPARPDPATLPTHDRHEGLLVATNSCLDADAAKQIFGKQNPFDAGILAIDVYFRNETAQAIRLNMQTIRLEVEGAGEDSQKLESLSIRQVATLIVYPQGPPDPSTKRKLPAGIPVPNHDKKVEKLADAFRPLALDADVIPPMATIHGYLFFDMAHDFSLARTSLLYVPDVHIIAGNKSLMFYEVPLVAAAAE